MELIHIANATFSSLSFKIKHSLENLASKQKLSGLLKSRRGARWHRQADHTTVARSRQRMREPSCWYVGSHELASSRVSRVTGGRYHKLVEPAGIEPATFWLQTRRSPS